LAVRGEGSIQAKGTRGSNGKYVLSESEWASSITGISLGVSSTTYTPHSVEWIKKDFFEDYDIEYNSNGIVYIR